MTECSICHKDFPSSEILLVMVFDGGFIVRAICKGCYKERTGEDPPEDDEDER